MTVKEIIDNLEWIISNYPHSISLNSVDEFGKEHCVWVGKAKWLPVPDREVNVLRITQIDMPERGEASYSIELTLKEALYFHNNK